MLKQRSESDSDSLSIETMSLHSDTWSNTSSRNTSPKPLRSTLKAPSSLKKLEKQKPIKQPLLRPTVKKVHRKAISKLEKKLSAETVSVVNELITEHAADKVVTGEDVSRLEEELKALLSIMLPSDTETTLAEELVALKLHDLIHRSFEETGGTVETVEESNGDDGGSGGNGGSDSETPKGKDTSAGDSGVSGGVSGSGAEARGGAGTGAVRAGSIETIVEHEGYGPANTTNKVTDIPDRVVDVTGVGNVMCASVGVSHVPVSSVSLKGKSLVALKDRGSNDLMDEVDGGEMNGFGNTEFEMQYWGKMGKDGIMRLQKSGCQWTIDGENEGSSLWEENMAYGSGETTTANNGVHIAAGGEAKPQRRRKKKDRSNSSSSASLSPKSGSGPSLSAASELSDSISSSGLLVGDLNHSQSQLAHCNTVGADTISSYENTDRNTAIDIKVDKPSFKSPNSLKQVSTTGLNLHQPTDITEAEIKTKHTDFTQEGSSLDLLKNAYSDLQVNDCSDDIKPLLTTIGQQINNRNNDLVNGDKSESDSVKESSPLAGVDSITLSPKSPKGKKLSKKKLAAKKPEPFLGVQDKEKFISFDWNTFPIVPDTKASQLSFGSSGRVSYSGIDASVNTEVQYFKIVDDLNNGRFVDSSLKIVKGNIRPSKLVVQTNGFHSLGSEGTEDIAAVHNVHKSTSTDDMPPMSNQENVEFLQTCMPEFSANELSCALEICNNNAEWAINLLLDWDYSLKLTEEEKKKFTDGMAEIQRCTSPEPEAEITTAKNSPLSLLDLCFTVVAKEHIITREEVEVQMIKTGKNRLESIEVDYISKFRYHRSNSFNASSVSGHDVSSSSIQDSPFRRSLSSPSPSMRPSVISEKMELGEDREGHTELTSNVSAVHSFARIDSEMFTYKDTEPGVPIAPTSQSASTNLEATGSHSRVTGESNRKTDVQLETRTEDDLDGVVESGVDVRLDPAAIQQLEQVFGHVQGRPPGRCILAFPCLSFQAEKFFCWKWCFMNFVYM